jgi:hypothetical protein
MTRAFLPVVLPVLFASFTGSLVAGPLNFAVTTNKKRFEVERTGTNSTSFTKEKWGYTITMENKSFQALSGLNVEYRQFKFADKLKGEGTLTGVKGVTKIDTLANGAKFKFDTDPVEIEKQELKTGWTYADSSKEKVKDALAGVWLRVMKDGQMVFEYQYPADLAKKAKWE